MAVQKHDGPTGISPGMEPSLQRLGADAVDGAVNQMASPIAGSGEEVAMRRDLGEGADRVQSVAQPDRSTR